MDNWIAIVDDDTANLRVASRILTREKMKVSCMKSGSELLHFLNGNTPDLLLLDIHMPDMDGFETISKVRSIDRFADLPVIFLTADEDTGTEAKALSCGAMDFIRKPFVDEVLSIRVHNILKLNRLHNDMVSEVEKKTSEIMSRHERISGLRAAAETDKLTGLLNRLSTQIAIGKMTASTSGVLMVFDIDSFKLVNDLYGKEAGDKILIHLSELLQSILRSSDIAGRIGGDEFIAYCEHITDESVIEEKARFINSDLIEFATQLLGPDMNIPLGVSVGAVLCPDEGKDYSTLFHKADEALYSVKQKGDHSCAFYWSMKHPHPESVETASSQALMILKERNAPSEAMLLSFEQFRTIFRLLSRLKNHDELESSVIHFTLDYTSRDIDRQNELMDMFLKHATSSLRTGDVLTKTSSNQCMVLLVNTDKSFSDNVAERIIDGWSQNEHSDEAKPTHEILLIP